MKCVREETRESLCVCAEREREHTKNNKKREVSEDSAKILYCNVIITTMTVAASFHSTSCHATSTQHYLDIVFSKEIILT